MAAVQALPPCSRGEGGEGGAAEGRGGKGGPAWLHAGSGITCTHRADQPCVNRRQQGAQRAGRHPGRRRADAWASPWAGGNR